MLSYRHGFHAGNHADILKHLCQMLILRKLTEKAKPFVYIDTHSGAGLYDLKNEQARKTNEFKTGISRLYEARPESEALSTFRQLVSNDYESNAYPGSPEIAKRLCREQDTMHMMELHNSEIHNLKRPMRSSNIHVHHRDGFEGLNALTPPKPARGLVLIDPPYESVSEYQQVFRCLENVTHKWATGIYAIWYPLLSARAGEKSGASETMLQRLADLDIKNALNVNLTIDNAEDDIGMYGSGVLILNAPYLLDEQLALALPELSRILDPKQKGGSHIHWLKESV